MQQLYTLALHFRSLLQQCARATALRPGKQLHVPATVTGLLSFPNLFLRNALPHLYASCSLPSHTRIMFDKIFHSHKDSVDYTTLIHHSSPLESLQLFTQMRQLGLPLDGVSMVCTLNACATIWDPDVGFQMHVGVVKWEGVESGRLVFDEMPERNEVAWTVMIVGYVGNGFTKEAFWLLKEMSFGCGFELNWVTLCFVLSACSQCRDVCIGRWVHGYAVKAMGLDLGVMVGTTLVDMYAKCGRISVALVVFRHMLRRNVVA